VQKQVPGLRVRIRGKRRCVPQTRKRLRALRRQAGSLAAYRRLSRKRRCTAYKPHRVDPPDGHAGAEHDLLQRSHRGTPPPPRPLPRAARDHRQRGERLADRADPLPRAPQAPLGLKAAGLHDVPVPQKHFGGPRTSAGDLQVFAAEVVGEGDPTA
jgi:hypothetical protein